MRKTLKKPPRNGAELRRQTIEEFEVTSSAALALLPPPPQRSIRH